MKVVFLGTPDFSVPALEALVEAGHDVVTAYTQPPRRAGRGKKERPSPVQRAAQALGIPVRYPVSLRDKDIQDAFARLDADVAVVVAYGLILPQPILDAPRDGCLNIHASLLPRWRGAAPIHRAILAGDTETGICIMQMEAGLDTGPVLARATLPIEPTDTTGSLHDKLASIGAETLTQTLNTLSTLTPKAQAETGVTYAEKIDKAEARIDWTQSATTVDRQIRGLSPFPGAWTTLNGKRLKLLASQTADETGRPGTVLNGLTIACGSKAVTITMLQAEGRGRQTQDDFLRGTPVPPGSKLGEN